MRQLGASVSHNGGLIGAGAAAARQEAIVWHRDHDDPLDPRHILYVHKDRRSTGSDQELHV